MDENEIAVWGKRFFEFIDRTTMYRLMFYYLLALFVAASLSSAAGYLSFSPLALLWSAVVFVISAWLVNKLFAVD